MEKALIIKKELYRNCDTGHSCYSKKTNIIENQGFKPSDCQDNIKKQFLIDLSKQMWIKDCTTSTAKNIDLQKLYTPATDIALKVPKQKKLYSSSVFYSPILHPTLEEQIAFARMISSSLTDVSNQKSKGQSMYMQRKTRSAKWVNEYSVSSQAKGNDFAMKSNEAYESSKQCQKNTDIVFTDPTVTIKYSKKFGNGVQNNSVTEFDSSNFKSSTSTMSKSTNVILDPKRSLAYRPCIPKGWKSPI